MLDQLTEPIPINEKPFNPFIIIYPNDHVILFFTQSFAQLYGFHPSIVLLPNPIPSINELDLDIQQFETLDCYEIQQFKQAVINHETPWIEELIHELRTASLTIDLGAHALADSEYLAPALLRKLLRASHRQKIATLIASDFLQLRTSSTSIHPVPLIKILTSGLSHSPFTTQMKFYISSTLRTDLVGHINPIIWGNFHFLSNFFTTLLSWLETESIILEMRTINPVSVQVTISIPDDHFLSYIQGFSLVTRYLRYIIAYFNGCSWVTQNSINILFPMTL
ncbi:MAG: hypothetical protein ACXADY_15205 [Candidatus Hodarchaeales archaeon]